MHLHDVKSKSMLDCKDYKKWPHMAVIGAKVRYLLSWHSKNCLRVDDAIVYASLAST